MNNLDKIEEIEGESGLYKVEKVKVTYFIGYGEKIGYMINLDTNKCVYRELKEK
jgi:hypothetical protein